MRILKFGGKSLATTEKVQKICKNIKKIYKNDKNIIIIVSAFGNTTDNLIKLSKIYYNNKYSQREMDALLATGETQAAALFALMLNSMNIPAKSFQGFQLQIKTFGEHQNSKIAYINKQPLIDCLKNNIIAIVAGFQGINSQNEVTTLGRGGSDTTAAAIGAIFDNKVEIYSDFDGIFAGDPRENNYKKIKFISYQSMKNIALSGAKVLDKRAVDIAEQNKINIICKQSDDFSASGSVVSNIEKSFISISSLNNLCQLSIDFSEDKNQILLFNNVLKSLNNIKIYNFNVKNNKIEILINQSDKQQLLDLLSSKLKLLKS